MTEPDPGIICFYNKDRTPAGLGFVVGAGLALTCAHVLEAMAHGIGKGAEVGFDFPQIEGHPGGKARILKLDPVADLAVLELIGSLPQGARPLKLLPQADVVHHSVSAFGLPQGNDDGTWISGSVLRRNTAGLLQVESGSTYVFKPGFSGGPIWDEDLAGVVGMLEQVDSGSKGRAAYCLPADKLIAALPPPAGKPTATQWRWLALAGLVLLVVVVLLLVKNPGPVPNPTSTPTPTRTSTPVRPTHQPFITPQGLTLTAAAGSLVLEISATPTATQSSTPTPSQTAESIAAKRTEDVPLNTPRPLSPAAISIANLERVTELAFWPKEEMSGAVYETLWLPDGQALVVTTDEYAFLLRSSDLSVARRVELPAFPRDGDLSARSAMLVWASLYDNIVLQDMASGALLNTLPNSEAANAVALSPDARLLATGIGLTLKLWDNLADNTGGRVVKIIPLHTEVRALAFTPDGRALIVVQNDVSLYAVPGGEKLFTLPDSSGIRCISLSPDGRTLAAGAYADGLIHLWDMLDGHEIRTIPAYAADSTTVVSVAFSPDGRLLASSAERDPTFKVWDASTGAELHTFVGHSLDVKNLAFSHDGAFLASGAEDGVKLWGLK